MKNNYEIRGDIAYIFLNNGKKAVIETKDLERVKELSGQWCCVPSKHTTYVSGWNGEKVVSLHRFIMNPKKKLVVDHINHNGLDNRRANLRVCTQAENTQNRGRRSKSGVRGVVRNTESEGWVVCVPILGVPIRKSFKSFDAAAKYAFETRAKYMPYSQEALIKKIEDKILGGDEARDEMKRFKDANCRLLYGRHWKDIIQYYED